MARRPDRPVDMPAEEKRKRVENLENILRQYQENPALLQKHLDGLRKPRKDSYAEGCFDPDAPGYDLYAETPVEQGSQIILFDEDLNSGTAGLFGYYNWPRVGDVLNTMRDKKYFCCLPGLGPKRYENLKQVFHNHGFPVGWLE